MTNMKFMECEFFKKNEFGEFFYHFCSLDSQVCHNKYLRITFNSEADSGTPINNC